MDKNDKMAELMEGYLEEGYIAPGGLVIVPEDDDLIDTDPVNESLDVASLTKEDKPA